jgi:phage FluMu protein Com
MTKIRCKSCNKELETSQVNKGVGCHCPNETYITLDRTGQVRISALDMSLIEIIEGAYKKRLTDSKKSDTILSDSDLQWQEARKTRKVSRNLLNSIQIR